jgi:geranylgeranyl pyrophosphate synthase/predicted secreted hydrolase
MPTSPLCWPDGGPVDLALHDAPHDSAEFEQWHVNCHVRDVDGAELSVFGAFLRLAFSDPVDGRRRFAHAVAWAVVDPATGGYHPSSQVDRSVPAYLRQLLGASGGPRSRIERALAEVLERGQVPLPDHLMETAPVVAPDGLHLDFDGCDLTGQDGRYDVTLSRRSEVSCSLRLHPRGPAVLHGTDDFATAGEDPQQLHYFLPGCEVSGRVELPSGRTFHIAEGSGWYEHQFGTFPAGPADLRGLVRTSTNIALSDGRVISASEIGVPSTGWAVDGTVVVVDADGTTQSSARVAFEPVEVWRSSRTFREYPTSYNVVAKDLELDLELEACAPDQELLTTLAPPAFWEGRCTVRGTIGGAPVSGRAFVAQRGAGAIEDVDALLGRVGEVVLSEVEGVLPRQPTREALHHLVGTASSRRLRGIDTDLLGSAISQPIRFIIDRGGKAWRSYLLLACCEAVGGDSRVFRKMLAVPEIVHAGSLIIDDIEDDSITRRGGPACHVEFGQALAINAGNAAYFIAPEILMSFEPVRRRPDNIRLQLYELYFRAMREAHAGQAMDLEGVHDLMPAAVSTGDVRRLEERILTCYRLKTGVPAACFAAMGAVLGGGNDRQVSAIVDYMEAAGVAFQIVDDVLNLTGFDGGQKTTGEDIFNGTVTLPLAKAFEVLDGPDRRELWSMYQAAGDDHSLAPAVIDALTDCGSLQASDAMANELMEKSWTALEKELDPSHATVMLRAFSWFVLERRH